MVDIQSPTAEIRRRKKIEARKKEPQGKNIMSASAIRWAVINQFLLVVKPTALKQQIS